MAMQESLTSLGQQIEALLKSNQQVLNELQRHHTRIEVLEEATPCVLPRTAQGSGPMPTGGNQHNAPRETNMHMHDVGAGTNQNNCGASEGAPIGNTVTSGTQGGPSCSGAQAGHPSGFMHSPPSAGPGIQGSPWG